MNIYAKYFAIHGTDKMLHGYHKHYEKVVGDSKIDRILEIGTRSGNSLMAWSDIWPDAIIESMDLLDPPENVSDKFKIHVASSRDCEYSSIVMTDEYDMIIDDGGHHWKDQLATFYNFYEKSNRFYVIEDIRGGYCLGRLIRELPMDVLTKISIFHSELDLGKINFTFSENKETQTCHFIMFIDKHKN
jgi:hypothetical protein